MVFGPPGNISPYQMQQSLRQKTPPSSTSKDPPNSLPTLGASNIATSEARTVEHHLILAVAQLEIGLWG